MARPEFTLLLNSTDVTQKNSRNESGPQWGATSLAISEMRSETKAK